MCFNSKRKVWLSLLIIVVMGVCILWGSGSVIGADNDLKPYISAVEQSRGGMSLWQMMKSGGFIMIVLAFLSIAATAIIVYDFKTLNVKNLSPKEFAEDIIQKLEGAKEHVVRDMCYSEENIFASVVMAGLAKKKRGAVLAREAMENCVRKEIGDMWQNISYLSDIAMVAPLVGLLGTVLGMIQAFNVVAFQSAVVKPILLAGGVSKAMVTTAGGLMVAIPIMLFYSYFRGKVQEISNVVESYSTDIIKVMEEMDGKSHRRKQ